MRVLTVPLDDVLSLAHCAEDYGFADDVLLSALGEMSGHVTDEEIDEYAAGFLTPEM